MGLRHTRFLMPIWLSLIRHCGQLGIAVNQSMAFFQRRSSSSQQPHYQSYGQPQPPRPFVQEDTLKTSELQVERKYFVMTLKENPRGRFLRITEEVGGRRSSVIIPASGLADFKKCVDEMVQAADEIQPATHLKLPENACSRAVTFRPVNSSLSWNVPAR